MKGNWRYEIKYTLSAEQAEYIPILLIQHPSAFISAYPDRIVNNIYLDNADIDSCHDNLAGISERKKVRIRWYGDPGNIQIPVLEEKIKNNTLGTKIQHQLKPSMAFHSLIDQAKKLIFNGYTLHATIQNCYKRSYFISSDKKFRLTVDRDIRYQSAHDFLMGKDLALSDDRIIIEIKFDQEDIKQLKEITRHIPFRQTKHSKYVSGVMGCLAYK